MLGFIIYKRGAGIHAPYVDKTHVICYNIAKQKRVLWEELQQKNAKRCIKSLERS